MHILGISTVLLSTIFSVVSLDIRGKVQWNDLCPGIGALGHAKAILDNGKMYFGGVTQNGDFHIPNVAPGTYILSLSSHDHHFDRLRIDIPEPGEASSDLPEIRPYIAGTPLSPPSKVLLPYPAILTARRKNEYFTPPASFNAVGMLQSPMVLMMVVAGVMMFAMPTLMKNMDPESLNDFNERHAKMTGMQQSFANGDFKSGFSQLLDASEDKPAVGTSSAVATPAKSSKGKSKRR